jgi:carbamoyl-phosphate synthase large subunit
MNKRLRILLTGVGAPGVRGTIYALERNPDSVDVSIVGIDMQPEAVGKYWVNAFHISPPPEHADYIPFISKLAQDHEIDCILPQTTRELLPLALNRETIGKPVVVADAKAIEASNDKYALLTVCKKEKIPYPDFVLVQNESEFQAALQRLNFPTNKIVVKPPKSNGMRGFRVLSETPITIDRFLNEKPNGIEMTSKEFLAIMGRNKWPPMLITEYLSGPEFSVDGFVGSRSQIAVPRLRKAIRSGISFYNEIVDRKDLVDFTLHLASQIGLRYAFGFQFKLDDSGVPKILECNPRVQGTMVASLFSGNNVIWMSVRECLGDPVDSKGARLKSIKFMRYWGGIGIDDEQCIGTI